MQQLATAASLQEAEGANPQGLFPFEPSSEDNIHSSVSFLDNGKHRDFADQTRKGHHVTS
jgi:hypothetical protein